MRRAALALSLAFALVIPLPAIAADLHMPSAEGATCEAGKIGTWHFVNNQTGGAGAGQLTVIFDGDKEVKVGPSSDGANQGVNRNMQHFYVSGKYQSITSAETNLPGRLVLSDFKCVKK